MKVLLHDLSRDKIIAGLHDATLELAVMAQATGEGMLGIEFEILRTYPWCVALTNAHPFSRLKSVSLEKLATEPLIGLRRKNYSEYYRILEQIFAAISAKPRIAMECDSISSLIMEGEAGSGIALVPTTLKLMSGKRLIYRPLTGTTETQSVGIARATKGDVTPAGKKFCEILRRKSVSKRRRLSVPERRVVLRSTIRSSSDLPEPEAARLSGRPGDIGPATRLVAPVLEPLARPNTDRAKTPWP